MQSESPSQTAFSQSKAYAEKGHVFVSLIHRKKNDAELNGNKFDDGREIELLHFVHRHPSIADIRGSPTRVLEVIDEFGLEKFMMNVGYDKGKIVTDLIAKVKPQVMVELGGYVGYSALLFGDALRKAGGKRYFSLERNPEFAAVIMSLVDLAGLSDIVKVVVGASGDSINRLSVNGLEHIDLLFLDHHKPAYLTDLKLCEDLGLIKHGSFLAADNVISPGNPPYLEYVRSSTQQKRDSQKESARDAAGSADKFPETTKDQYAKKEGTEHTADISGNPNLVYESKLIKSFEPTGLPVSQHNEN